MVGLEVEGQEGPIERFERCRGAEELVMGDITCQSPPIPFLIFFVFVYEGVV